MQGPATSPASCRGWPSPPRRRPTSAASSASPTGRSTECRCRRPGAATAAVLPSAGTLRSSCRHDLLGMTPYTSRGSSVARKPSHPPDLSTPVSFFLFNPLTGEQILLPPLNLLEVLQNLASEPGGGYVVRGRPGPDFSCDLEYISRHFVHRFVLSSDPTSADCVVMASFCHGATFAFCRPGGGSWTNLTSPVTPVAGIRDIIFYEGRFYAVDGRLVLYVCDVGPPPRIEEFPFSWEGTPWRPREGCLVKGRRRRGLIMDGVYLVVSRGDLLMVLKTYDTLYAHPGDGEEEEERHHRVLDFEAYKLDLSAELPRWIELESLGDCVLFLGPVQSLSLSTGDFLRRNCIYFSDYRPEKYPTATVHGRGPDFGVFDYGSGRVERVPCCPVDAGSIWQPSIWISPTLRGISYWE